MISILDKTKCCGCTACYNNCPKQCISMRPDEEGFLYPAIDERQCLNCGLCENVCPVLNHSVDNNRKLPIAYIIRTNSQKDLSESTSGGFSTPLAKWIFQQRGSVWTAGYDENWNVIHREYKRDDEEFKKTRGSKYVQSRLGGCFSKIRNELDEGMPVCFIGTTCQVYGLKQFLKKEYDNLITVDLVCHGTPSPKLWRKYLDYQTEKYGSKIEKINFRNKTYGYHSGTMKLIFENGKTYTGSARVDYMLKSFFSEISSRPSCYSCAFKHENRISDFTVFDCWHMGELLDKKDDDRGYTNLLIHSDKGKKILHRILSEYTVFPVDAKKAIELDGIMVNHSATPHPERDEFYTDLDKQNLKEHIQKYIKVTTKDKILESVKGIAYRMGLMKILRNLKM